MPTRGWKSVRTRDIVRLTERNYGGTLRSPPSRKENEVTQEPKLARSAWQRRCPRRFYPLSPIPYPLGGHKSLAVKRLPATSCGSRTCTEKVLEPMILKNRARGGSTKCGRLDRRLSSRDGFSHRGICFSTPKRRSSKGKQIPRRLKPPRDDNPWGCQQSQFEFELETRNCTGKLGTRNCSTPAAGQTGGGKSGRSATTPPPPPVQRARPAS